MNLDSFFYPKSIAIIGASDKVGSIGRALFSNLQSHNIYPVNPNQKTINGQRCYPKINDIPVDIDLVIIAVPAKFVPIVVDEVAQKGTKNIIIISSGFKEVGHSDLEDLIKLICQKNNISLLGPNCLGLLNPETTLNASFAASIPRFGNIAFLSQSGAICTSIIDSAQKYNLGYSKFISLGNKTILDENNFLTYLDHDPHTHVIAIYTEQLVSPSALFQVKKPVIVLKSGRTVEGISAAKSHTGALAGRDPGYTALFNQTGAIRADTLADFLNFQIIFSQNQLPHSHSLTIVTNAGGVGVLAADAAASNGLTVDKLDDLLGDATADKYEQSLNQNQSDNLLVILTPQSVTEIDKTASVLINYKNKTKHPLAVCFLGDESVAGAIKLMRQNNLSVFDYPEDAIRSLAALSKYALFKSGPSPELFPVYEPANTYGLPLISSQIAANETEAINIATKINKPVVLKISSPDILHKSDVGGVVLNVNPLNIKSEFNSLLNHIKSTQPHAQIDGVLIEEMVDKSAGVELIIGSVLDPSLGQIIMVGAGGIYTEIIKDSAFGVVPITRTDAKNMIDELKIKKILDGARGSLPLDVDAVVDCLGRMSQMLTDNPEIKEIDINPLLVLPQGQGAKILDFRIIK